MNDNSGFGFAVSSSCFLVIVFWSFVFLRGSRFLEIDEDVVFLNDSE